jgi:hypothetical protein
MRGQGSLTVSMESGELDTAIKVCGYRTSLLYTREVRISLAVSIEYGQLATAVKVSGYITAVHI